MIPLSPATATSTAPRASRHPHIIMHWHLSDRALIRAGTAHQAKGSSRAQIFIRLSIFMIFPIIPYWKISLAVFFFFKTATPFRSPGLFLCATIPVPMRILNIMMLRSLHRKGFHILINFHNKGKIKIDLKKLYKNRVIFFSLMTLIVASMQHQKDQGSPWKQHVPGTISVGFCSCAVCLDFYQATELHQKIISGVYFRLLNFGLLLSRTKNGKVYVSFLSCNYTE